MNQHERAICPSCSTPSDTILKGDILDAAKKAGLGPYAVRQAAGHYDVSRWKKGYVYQNRELPHQAPPGTFIRLPSTLLDRLAFQLSNLELRLLLVLLRMSDSRTGWTPPISHGTLGLYCMSRGRAKAVERETIGKALDQMSLIKTSLPRPDGRPQTASLVTWTQTFPRRYKVNL